MDLIVIGTGKMAEAIIAGASKEFKITIIGRDTKRLSYFVEKYPNIESTGLLDSPIEVEGKDIILAIKPNALESISIFLSGEANAIISVLAGVSLDELKDKLNAKYFIRAMPNLAATYQKSMTTIYGDIEYKESAIKICESFGNVLWLEKESDISICTALAGSAPAFLAIVAEALEDGAVREGLKRDSARVVISALFEGFSELLKHNEPTLIKQEVMSPGGTTAEGCFELEDSAVRSAFIKAISSATKKARG